MTSQVLTFPTPKAAPPKPKREKWSNARLRDLQPGAKEYKQLIDDNLYLRVAPAKNDPDGNKSWLFRFKQNGKGKMHGLGSFPAVTLEDARAMVAERKRQRAHGVDLTTQREAAKAARRAESASFERVAGEWLALNKPPKWTEHHYGDVQHRLAMEVFPKIGRKPIATVTRGDCCDIIDAIVPRSVDLAHRCRARLKAIFDYGIGRDYCTTNPAEKMEAVMPSKAKDGYRPAILALQPLREMLATVEDLPAAPQIKAANRFIALTAMRPGEVRLAKWSQFEGLDGDNPLWRVPGYLLPNVKQMKMGRPHTVPLSRQAVELLQALHRYTGQCDWVFPAAAGALRPIGHNSVNHWLARAGFHDIHCPHGWRRSFSTIINEAHGSTKENLVEASLAHAKDDKVAERYNSAEYIAARRLIMQEWADLLLADADPADLMLCGRRRR